MKSLYDSNQYFIQGKSWFEVCYSSSNLYRNLYFFIAILLLGAIICSALIMNNFFPMLSKPSIVITDKNFRSDSIKFTKLDKYSHPNLSVAKLLIQNYINIRENYQYSGVYSINDARSRVEKLQNLSSKIVMNEFLASSGGYDDFLYLLKNQITKKTSVIDIKYKGGSSFADNLLYMIYPGKIPDTAAATIETNINGKIDRYSIDIQFFLKIPQQSKINQENEIGNLKSYLTGIDAKFDSKIEFIILQYKKIKIT